MDKWEYQGAANINIKFPSVAVSADSHIDWPMSTLPVINGRLRQAEAARSLVRHEDLRLSLPGFAHCCIVQYSILQ